MTVSPRASALCKTFLTVICAILCFSCDVDYINGGEVRILLMTEDYSLAYSYDFTATITFHDKDITHSAKMIKNAAGDGASVEFPNMKEGKWTVEVEIHEGDLLKLTTETDFEVEARKIASVRGYLSEDTEGLALIWTGDGDAAEQTEALTISDFQLLNMISSDFTNTGFGERVPLTLGYLTGSQFNNLEFFSLLYPDGTRIESGSPRGMPEAYEIFFDGSSVLSIYRAGNTSSGDGLILIHDENGNSYSMENGIGGDSPADSYLADVYPESGGWVYETGDTFTWQYFGDTEWIENQLFITADVTTNSVIDKIVLDSSILSRSASGLSMGDDYILLILAVDSVIDASMLDSITDAGFAGDLIPLVLNHTAGDNEADFISYFLGDFYVSY